MNRPSSQTQPRPAARSYEEHRSATSRFNNHPFPYAYDTSMSQDYSQDEQVIRQPIDSGRRSSSRRHEPSQLLFPRSHPTPPKDSELLRKYQTRPLSSSSGNPQQTAYAQSWTPEKSHEQRRVNDLMLRNSTDSRRNSNKERSTTSPLTAAAHKNNNNKLSQAQAASSSAFSSPARRHTAVSEPGTPSSQERVQAYLKQRHAHALLRTQQSKAKNNNATRSSHSRSSSSSNHEEKKDDHEIVPQEAKETAPTTSRLRSLLHKHKPSFPHATSSSGNKQHYESLAAEPESKVAHHLEDFMEIMNSTHESNDTFTTDPEVFDQEQIVLEFLKPTREDTIKTTTATTAAKALSSSTARNVVSAKSIQAAHLAHRHAHPDEFPPSSSPPPQKDDIRHPPLLQRHHQSPLAKGGITAKEQPRQGDTDKSTSMTVGSLSSPSPVSRVQAIKHKLWEEERLKPQTEAWQRKQRASGFEEVVPVKRAPVQDEPKQQQQDSCKPFVISDKRQDQFQKSRFAQAYNLQTVPSAEPVRKELKPPAMVESARRNISRLDSKLARHARSLSPRASRSTASLKSGATASTLFSSRFVDAAVRTTPDRSVHSKTSALRPSTTRPSTPVASANTKDTMPAAASVSEKSYSELVAQLKTVSRHDAAAALAQIDAILAQQETPSRVPREERGPIPARQRPWRTSPAPSSSPVRTSRLDNEAEELSDDDDEDDDETSVSSITNPTYAVATAAAPSSGGKPRPSGLQAYTKIQSRKLKDEFNAARQIETALSDKASRKKKKRSGTPPPASIETKSAGTVMRSNLVVAANNDFSMVKPNQKQRNVASREDDNSLCTDSHSAATSILGRVESSASPINPEIDDPIVDATNAKDIAEKISRWDQLTDTFSRVFSFDGPDGKGSNKFNEDLTSKRPHPWDSTKLRNRVDLRETSMDAADGLEAKIVTPETSTSNYSSATPSRSFREVDFSVGETFVNKSGSWGRAASRDWDSSPVAAEKLIVHDLSHDLSNLSHDFDMLANSLSREKKSWVAVPSSPFFPAKEKGVEATREQQRDGRSSYFDDDERDGSNPFTDSLPRSTNPFDDDNIQHGTARRLMDMSTERFATNPFDESSESRSSGERNWSSRKSAPVSRIGKQSFEQCSNDSSREARSFGRRSHEHGFMAGSFDENERSSIEVALAPPPQKRTVLRRLRELAPPQYDESVELMDDSKPSHGIKSFLKRRNSGSTGRSVSSRSRPSERSTRSHSLERKGSRTTTDLNYDESTPRGRRRRSKSPSRERARSLDERRIRNPSIARKFGRLLRVYDYENDPLYDELKKLNV